VLLTWFPGQEMGDAIADVLTGAREPGGRIPTTWPAHEEDVPVWQVEPVDGRLYYSEGLHVGYREWMRRAVSGGPAPAIPFGHGLGYTQWKLGDARIDTSGGDTSAASGFGVSLAVTNTGDRAGKQVVQVYLSRTSASEIDRPVLWLAGFAVVHARPGQTAAAQIDVEPRALQYWSVEEHAWRTEPGTYAVQVGTSIARLSEPIPLAV